MCPPGQRLHSDYLLCCKLLFKHTSTHTATHTCTHTHTQAHTHSHTPTHTIMVSYDFPPTVSCERGMFSSEAELSRIVNGVGYSEIVPVCQPCPLDTYTDQLGTSVCLPCPKYHSTTSTGATSIQDCLGKYHAIHWWCVLLLCFII